MCGRFRQMAGVLLVLSGVLIVFLCLPMEFFLIALGVALAAAGLLLLRGKGGRKEMGVKMVCIKPPKFLRALLRLLTGKAA